MGFYSCNKFRFVVIILLIVIIWQIFRLLNRNQENGSNNAVVQPIQREILEDEDRSLLKITVFYEALCPDSRHFFLHHLVPVEDKLSQYINVELIPYGNAQTITDSNGKLKFSCQHGETECYANKIHACSIDILSNQSLKVHFTNCMILDNMKPNEALERCGKELNVETENIMECANSDRGSELLKQHGTDTAVVHHTFIPTVLLNDGAKDIQPAILKNLLLQVCKKLKDPLPHACL